MCDYFIILAGGSFVLSSGSGIKEFGRQSG